MEVPFEEFYKEPRNREIFVAKSVIQLIIDGYSVDEEEIKEFFTFEDIQGKLIKVQTKYNNQ